LREAFQVKPILATMHPPLHSQKGTPTRRVERTAVRCVLTVRDPQLRPGMAIQFPCPNGLGKKP
jgi:hypothetical protein